MARFRTPIGHLTRSVNLPKLEAAWAPRARFRLVVPLPTYAQNQNGTCGFAYGIYSRLWQEQCPPNEAGSILVPRDLFTILGVSTRTATKKKLEQDQNCVVTGNRSDLWFSPTRSCLQIVAPCRNTLDWLTVAASQLCRTKG